MKMKNYALGLVLPTLFAAIATEAGASNAFCGFYTGGSAGGLFTSARTALSRDSRTFVSIRSGIYTVEIPNSVSVQSMQRKNNIAATLYAGYGYAYQGLYFGLEAFLKYAKYKAESVSRFTNEMNLLQPTGQVNLSLLVKSANSTITKTKLGQLEPGIDFRPGVFLTPGTLLYGRIGMAYNKASVTAALNDNLSVSGVGPLAVQSTLNPTILLNKHQKIGVLRLGLGFEQRICHNMSIRADFIHTNYRGVKMGKQTNVVSSASGLTLTQSNNFLLKSLSNNAVMLGISYYL